MTDVAITELLEIDPDRVDAVTSPANGTEWLILKSLDGEGDDIIKTDDGREDCSTCHGDGKILGNKRKCPDCMGSGIKPKPGDTEKSLMDAATARKEAGVAASGADVPVDSVCGHCKGSGQDATGQCDACGGTGKDADTPPVSELNTVDADAGKITEGAGGRETVDKALAEYGIELDDYIAKRNFDASTGGGVDRDKIPAADFAGPKNADGDPTYPIVTPKDVADAATLIGKADNPDAVKAKIIAIAKRKGAEFVAQLPKSWTSDDAEKASSDPSIFSAPNPALSTAATQVTDSGDGDDDTPDAGAPGSPEWEAVDAQTATDAALALMTAAELIRTFAQRESTEVAVGEGNDIFDAYAASEALCGVSQALGIMSQMAFHEGLAAAKSLDLETDDVVVKAGRRLAGKTVTALAVARDKAKDLADHIGGVLGDDDPAKKNGESAKSQKDILDMTEDDLQTLVATTVAQAVVAAKSAEAELEKAGQDVDNTDSIAAGKNANNKSKKKMPKADNTDLEDEADQGTNDSASSPATGAAKAESDEPDDGADDAVKAELTPEQIEARNVAKAAKKAAKEAKRAEKELATKVALTKSIEESLKTVVEQNEVLKSTVDTLTAELEGVKKMAAPSTIVRTAPVDAQNVAKARDEVELRIATLEREARETSDPAVRAGNREIVKELRASQTATK